MRECFSSSNMRTGFLFFSLYTSWLLICSSPICFAGDTLSTGQKIIGNETLTNLVSAGKIFELGFFTPNMSGDSQRYLGIWYHMQEGSEQPQKQTVVWVANRDNPVAVNSTGVFQIAEDGNLVVVDTSGNEKRYWSSNSNSNSKVKDSSPKNMTVKLMDSGNLVLLENDEHKGVKLWESFENPTDTFLPGMKMERNLKLTSWRSVEDPGSGNFSFNMEQTKGVFGVNRFNILNQDQIYWESEEYNTLTFREKFDQVDDINSEVYNLLTNFSLLEKKEQIPMKNYGNTRLFIDSSGVIQWVENNLLGGELLVRWMQPKTKCLTYNVCGNFATCNDDDKVCKCLPGFYNEYRGKDKAGCKRRTSSSSSWCTGKDTAFLNLTMIKTGRPDKKETVQYEEDCASMCIEMCPQCQAYSYAPLPTNYQRSVSPTNCWIWTRNLTTLKEEYTNWDHYRRLIVLVDKSDIAPTPRTCEPCGINTIPYPLSSGSNCGDLKYFNFKCNASTGQLSFTTTNNVSYRIVRVQTSLRTFTINNKDNYFNRYCDEASNHQEIMKVSSPFHTNDDSCSEKVEISWEPPSDEPICDNSVDCHGWKNSTCSTGNRCLCNSNYKWNGEFLSCSQSFSETRTSPNATKESTKGNSKRSFSLILGLTISGVVILACIISIAYACRRRIAHMVKQDKESIQRNIRGGFYDSERHVKDLIDMEGLEEKDNEGIEVPYFDFESILKATNDFSEANKLGKGGYGPVYKGIIACLDLLELFVNFAIDFLNIGVLMKEYVWLSAILDLGWDRICHY